MGKKELSILIIEDNPVDQRLAQAYLSEINEYECSLHFADRISTAITTLKSENIDLALVDLGLPDSAGLDTFYKLHKEFPNMPLIIISGFNDEDVANKAVQDGAHDYIVKGSFDSKSLNRSIRYAIKRQQIRVSMQGQIEASFNQDSAVQTEQVIDVQQNIKERLVDSKASSSSLKKTKVLPELIETYESILQALLDAKLVKSQAINQSIQDLAEDLYKNNFYPEEVDDFRIKQSLVPSDNALLYKVNSDIVSEMIGYVYQEVFNTKLS